MFYLRNKNEKLCIFVYSDMTWFFSPIKSTDTNSALLADIKPRFPI